MQGINLAAHTGIVGTLNRLEEARREKANMLARAYRSAARWQAMALGELAVVLVLTGVCGWLATSGVRVIPYVVRVDNFGREQVLEPWPTHPVRPPQTAVYDTIKNWIEDVRNISNDPVVFKQNWDRVALYTTQAGWQQLTPFHKEQIARQLLGRRALVTVGQVLPIGKQSWSYTVEWREEVYDQSGQLLPEESGLWKATVRVADWQSKAAQEAFNLLRAKRTYRNIQGIVVDEISWSMRPVPQ
jgi:type IV secretory pathway TrbF-like protein